jgi:hypothetical protein
MVGLNRERAWLSGRAPIYGLEDLVTLADDANTVTVSRKIHAGTVANDDGYDGTGKVPSVRWPHDALKDSLTVHRNTYPTIFDKDQRNDIRVNRFGFWFVLGVRHARHGRGCRGD